MSHEYCIDLFFEKKLADEIGYRCYSSNHWIIKTIAVVIVWSESQSSTPSQPERAVTKKLEGTGQPELQLQDTKVMSAKWARHLDQCCQHQIPPAVKV